MNEVEVKDLQQKLIDFLVEKDILHSEVVEAAFRAVPRHLFVPDASLEDAYKNAAIPTKQGESGLAISSSSQPAIMVIMLEQLALRPGDNVLEIGAGTGFNAALMGHIVGEGGHVTTMDIDLDIVEGAREHLAAAGCENVTVVCGDGAHGFPGNGPYDAIILTVGCWEIAPAWVSQLKEDGRLVLPLSLNGPQFSIRFEREGEGLASRSAVACGFMALRGDYADPEVLLTLNEDKTVFLNYKAGREIDGEQVLAWLNGVGEDSAVGLAMTQMEIWNGFSLWVALHEQEQVNLGARGEGVKEIPFLIGGPPNPWGMTAGLVGEEGMAFFMRPPSEESPEEESEEPKPFELQVRAYGRAGALVERLKRHALDWDKNGRPGLEGMRVRVYPLDEKRQGAAILRQRRHQFVIDWPK